ncbi:hypothetical protein SAMN04488567_0981 [Limimaricola pyoseonensis]|uniref:Tetratricopeptide repeat-containing protein n=1 Tax=Limimaricola pyoseonensis TaxID=521013 RepID=A0A1G7AJ80_9RHOB|nr:hypothetical protein SAMN04488567_0981 [Limimaricola pyoseonensis]
MKKYFLGGALVGLIFFGGVSLADTSNVEANRIAVEAIQLWNRASSSSSSSFEDQLASLEAVEAMLNEIAENYPESEVGLSLLGGEELGPLSLEGIKEEVIAARAKVGEINCEIDVHTLCLAEEIINIGGKIEGNISLDFQIAEVAAALGSLGAYDIAKDVAKLAGSEIFAEGALSWIARAAAARNDWGAAKNLSELVVAEGPRTVILSSIVGEMVKAGMVEEAINIASSDPDFSGRLMYSAAKALMENGDTSLALETMSSGLEMLRQRVKDKAIAETFLSFAGSYYDLGRDELGRAAFDEAILLSLSISDEREARDFQKALAIELSRAGLISEAEEALKSIQDEYYRSSAMSQVATNEAIHGNLFGGLDKIKSVPIEDFKSGYFLSLIQGLAESGKFQDARKVVGELDDLEDEIRALAYISVLMDQHGFTEDARDLTSKMFVIDYESRYLPIVVAEHGRDFAKLAGDESIAAMFSTALNRVDELEARSDLGWAYSGEYSVDVAAGLAALGDLRRSLAIIEPITDLDKRMDALLAVTKASVKADPV